MLNRETYLQQKGADLVQALTQSQAQKHLRDTGYSAANTHAEVTESSSGFTLSLVGPDYWRYQQAGRGPNRSGKPSRAMVSKMKQWALRHGMDEGAGYPIAVKIAREGIAVPNPNNPGGVVSEPLNPARLAEEIKNELTPLIREEINALLFA